MFPRSIKNPVPDVIEDARPLVKDEERFQEEKEREDAEKTMGEKHVFWPEED